MGLGGSKHSLVSLDELNQLIDTLKKSGLVVEIKIHSEPKPEPPAVINEVKALVDIKGVGPVTVEKLADLCDIHTLDQLAGTFLLCNRDGIALIEWGEKRGMPNGAMRALTEWCEHAYPKVP